MPLGQADDAKQGKGSTMMEFKRAGAAAAFGLAALFAAGAAQAQTKVAIGISGWTGFAPLGAQPRARRSGSFHSENG